MPTPTGGPSSVVLPPSRRFDNLARWSAHSSCPPTGLALDVGLATATERHAGSATGIGPAREPLTPPPEPDAVCRTGLSDLPSPQVDGRECTEELTAANALTPISTTSDADERETRIDESAVRAPSPLPGDGRMQDDFSHIRVLPNISSSFLRSGSRFRGWQRSERQEYKVEVEVKYVDMDQSFICGYLKIQGLTEDHPTLTTYFEGEIIGEKYSFFTQHPEWGSNDRVDLQHWAKFGAWRPFAKPAKKSECTIRNFAQKEHLFMRWKEHFLVPDHRVRSITGASFEGFYYICFNQITGAVSGIYFHAKSEKHQKLELTHVKERGCFGAVEFR